MDHRVVGSFRPFDFRPVLLPCFLHSFLFQSLDPGMCSLSFARTLRLAFFRGCALSLAFRFVFGLAFALPLAFLRLLNSFAFLLGCSRGCHVF